MKYSTLISICLSLLLSGCAIPPNLGKSPEMWSLQAIATERSIYAKQKRQWPKTQWWTVYGDGQLNALIATAYINSPLIAAADARVQKANALALQAQASLYPHLSINGVYDRARLSYHLLGEEKRIIPKGFLNFASGTLNMHFECDFWGKNRNLLAAAASRSAAVALEREHVWLVLATSIATVYAELAQLYVNLDAIDDLLKVHEQLAYLIKEREKHGLENKGSYEEEIALKANLAAQVAALQEAIELVKNKLAALVGTGPDLAATIARPNIKNLKSFGLPGNLPAEFLGRRPDIIAARLMAEAAVKHTVAVKASFYPNINLLGFVGHQSLGLNYFTAAHSLTAAVSPTLSLPILDGGALRAQYRLARASHAEAVAVYNETLLHALNEVADVVTNEKWLIVRLQNTKASVKASQEVYTVVNNRYKQGLVSHIAVLQAKCALTTNRRILDELQTRAFTLDIALVRALGGGFVSNKA